MATYPNPGLRQKLTRLGVPDSDQTFESLLSMLPVMDPSITDVNSVAEVLIYLIGKNIIRLPAFSSDSLIRDVAYGNHICQFYRNSDELISLLLPFFRQGLERNHRGIWIVSSPLTLDLVTKALDIGGMAGCVAKGQIQIHTADKWYMNDDGRMKSHNEIMEAWSEKERLALKEGYNGLRITGDTRFVVTDRDWQALMEYEAKVHGIINNSRIIAICSYTFGKGANTNLKKILNSHNEVALDNGRSWHRINTANVKEAEVMLASISRNTN